MNPIAAIKRLFARHIVADVPPALNVCEACRVPDCTNAQAAVCERLRKSIQDVPLSTKETK